MTFYGRKDDHSIGATSSPDGADTDLVLYGKIPALHWVKERPSMNWRIQGGGSDANASMCELAVPLAYKEN